MTSICYLASGYFTIGCKNVDVKNNVLKFLPLWREKKSDKTATGMQNTNK